MARRRNFLFSIDIGMSLAQRRVARFRMGSAIGAPLPKYSVRTINPILIGQYPGNPHLSINSSLYGGILATAT